MLQSSAQFTLLGLGILVMAGCQTAEPKDRVTQQKKLNLPYMLATSPIIVVAFALDLVTTVPLWLLLGDDASLPALTSMAMVMLWGWLP